MAPKDKKVSASTAMPTCVVILEQSLPEPLSTVEEGQDEIPRLPDRRWRLAAVGRPGCCARRPAGPPNAAATPHTQTHIVPLLQAGQLVRTALGSTVTVLGAKAAAKGEPLRLWVRYASGLEAPLDERTPPAAMAAQAQQEGAIGMPPCSGEG